MAELGQDGPGLAGCDVAGMYAMVPFREDKNLGAAYNEAMELLPDGSWAIFLDHDAMPTTPNWYRQFREAIQMLPDAGAICAMTNRCARKWQRIGDKRSNDVAEHRAFGAQRAKIRTLLDVSSTRGFAGTMFAVNKTAWEEAGHFASGLGCVDHSLHHRLKAVRRRVYMHEGIYAYHWRHYGEPDPTANAQKWEECPCMLMEDIQPKIRISLP